MVSKQHEGLINVMLTDVAMPEMSGNKLAECLKVLRPEMKVLSMSGYADNVVAHRGVISQDVAFLEKPFTPYVVADEVRQVLMKRKEGKATERKQCPGFSC